jgi:xylose isomerase
MLGSIDANQGDLLLGWDTDQFPTNIYETISVMYELLRSGGFKSGGLNFDAKLRRASYLVDDLFHAYIAGMDTFAIGLRVAARLLEDQVYESHLQARYASYRSGIGKKIVEGSVGLKELEAYVIEKGTLEPNASGQQEYLEAVLNQYLLGH